MPNKRRASARSATGRDLDVAAEFLAHRREDAIGEIPFIAGGETLVKGGGDDLRGTPRSMALCTVHLPSPSRRRATELGELSVAERAMAVMSKRKEVTTLPRRHTSAMAETSRSYWYLQGSRSGAVSASLRRAADPRSARSRIAIPSA